jgi:hypothetical protein
LPKGGTAATNFPIIPLFIWEATPMRRTITYLMSGIMYVIAAINIASAGAGCTSDRLLKDKRPGQNSIGLEFAYESRFEKFTPYANKFIWCITNKSALPAFFRWGTSNEESKYFGSLVLAQQAKDNWLTDSTGVELHNRIIKFMPTDSTKWQSISPQTFHVKESNLNGSSVRLTSEAFHTIQLQFDLKDPRIIEYLTPDGLVDLPKLSANPFLFKLFLQNEGGGVRISQSGVITVKASNAFLSCRAAWYPSPGKPRQRTSHGTSKAFGQG